MPTGTGVSPTLTLLPSLTQGGPDSQVSVEHETKTLQCGERQHVLYIAGQRGSVFDPVAMYLLYVAAHPASDTTPMFVYWDGGVLVPLTFATLVAGAAKDGCQACGSSHT
jgi:hypothetical protein